MSCFRKAVYDVCVCVSLAVDFWLRWCPGLVSLCPGLLLVEGNGRGQQAMEQGSKRKPC